MTGRSFVPLRRDSGGPSIVCFPWSGAGALPFRSWARADPTVDLLVARHGGREDRFREPAPTDFHQLVAELCDDLPAGPAYTFFGHCLGALLAFEVARELRRRGRDLPRRLVAVGESPSRSTAEGSDVDDLRERLRRSGTVPRDVLDDPQMFAIIEPVIRADMTLANSYRYEPAEPLDCPVEVMVDVEQSALLGPDMYGWAAVSRAVSATVIEGGALYPHGVWPAVGQAVSAAARRG